AKEFRVGGHPAQPAAAGSEALKSLRFGQLKGELKMQHASGSFSPLLAILALAWAVPAEAASHREAPQIAMDPAADNTDVYAFVSYDAANLARAPADRRVTFILNVNPGQDPSDGPNYFNFDDEVLYAINIDNDRDGKADDIVYEFRFRTEDRPVG